EVAHLGELLASNAEIEGAARLAELWPNLRAAVDWAIDNEDLALATALVGPVAAQAFCRRGVGELADWFVRILALADPDDDDTRSLGLLWIAVYHSMTHDRDAYRSVEERYPPPDHVLAVFAHAVGIDDNEAMSDAAPPAIAELRRRGEHNLATMFDLFSAGALLGRGELEETERRMTELAERFGRDGPPTFHNWALYMLAAGADFLGDTERAEALYDEVRKVRVPPFTNSPNEILETRAAFRRGDEIEAFLVMRRYIDELLAVGNMSGAGLLSIEFVNMMASTGRLTEAAPLLGYLDRSGILDVQGPGFRVLVMEASETVDGDPDALEVRRRIAAEDVPDEWALSTIGEALDRLLDRPLDQGSTAAAPPGDRPTSSSGA
ncbi:MAG: AfsR/SARP family transcriptional regulator, partial [Ilumatobacteraceae bacterium]